MWNAYYRQIHRNKVLAVTQGRGQGRPGSDFKEGRVCFCVDDRVLELGNGDGCISL